jgi:NADH:ubiquinone oxidoreductase subunit K
MFFGINYFLVSSAISIHDMEGLIVSIFILTVAATESAIALGLLVLYYKVFNNVVFSF